MPENEQLTTELQLSELKAALIRIVFQLKSDECYTKDDAASELYALTRSEPF